MVVWKRFKYGIFAVLTALFCVMATPAIASLTHSSGDQVGDSTLIHSPFLTAQGLVDQGRDRYEAGQFNEAVRLLQQAVERYATEGNDLQQAIALSNVSLAHQSLGNWDEANAAMDTSLMLLEHLSLDSSGQGSVITQVLAVQGRLQFAQGQYKGAFDTWEQVTQYYRQQGDQSKMIDSQLNQTQALQALGFYNQAIEQLEDIQAMLTAEPDSPTKVAALRNLGKALRISGDLGNPTDIPDGVATGEFAFNVREPEAQPDEGGSSLNATKVLIDALVTAQHLGMDEAIARIAINLGDISQAQALQVKDYEIEEWLTKAIDLYNAAIARSSSPKTQIDARLRQFRLYVGQLSQTGETQNLDNNQLSQWEKAQRLRTQIQLQLQSLSPSRTTIYQRVVLAQGLTEFKQVSSTDSAANFADSTTHSTLQPIQWREIAQLLATANQQAEGLQDGRAQAYVLGELGAVYEKASQDANFTGSNAESARLSTESEHLTQQALRLSLTLNASDISYRWYWQLARLRRQARDRDGAIAAYDESIKAIKSLRADLTGVDQNVQFSFRDNIEPIYREFVALLLDPDPVTKASPSDKDIDRARQTIEDLQLAELDNFFRESCLNAKEVDISEIDEIDRQAAVIYPIILSDRLEVILGLPGSQIQDQALSGMAKQEHRSSSEHESSGRTLTHITQPVPQDEIEEDIQKISLSLKAGASNSESVEIKQRLSRLYQWLIAPFADELEASNVKTLVFVLDGNLRSIPMAALFDGDQYLIEKYSIALTPGLQLTESALPDVSNLEVLMGGLSKPINDEFGALPNVERELDQIASTVSSSRRLFNEQFTNAAIKNRVNRSSSPVVHLATHGKFSAQFDNTFLLTWDKKINIRDLSTLLQSSELNRRRPIELLVLSACETASGSDRAALGLAGMAVRSGARSTLATLWSVNDASTSEAMQTFYKTWVEEGVTKAEALRQAQLSLLRKDEFSEPYFWAPFVLLGNWL